MFWSFVAGGAFTLFIDRYGKRLWLPVWSRIKSRVGL